MRMPEKWGAARATLAIAAITAASWLLLDLLRLTSWAAIWGGFIPQRVSGVAGDEALAPVWLTPLTATLIHGGFVHLLFNVVILLFCGRAVEPIVGRAGLIVLYVAGAYAAAAGQCVLTYDPAMPMIGASGAISSILGAYALLFGRNRVKVENARLAVLLHALWLGAAWIVLQLLSAFAFQSLGTQIAIAAHIGGFIAGLILAKPLFLFRYRKA